MNDSEINIAIAEACGWRKETVSGYDSEMQGDFTETHWLNPKAQRCLNAPDYCHDLNAMHEAEELLNELVIGDYHFWLIEQSGQAHMVPGCCPVASKLFVLTHADASQRAEAFLRVKGLWRES